MLRKLWVISNVYLTNRANWWIAGAIGMMFILLHNYRQSEFHANNPFQQQCVVFVPAIFMFFGIFIGHNVKVQFADPRSRMIPGFAWPHLLLASVLALGSLFMVPAIFDHYVPGAMLLSFCMLVLGWWGIHWQTTAATLPAFGLCVITGLGFWLLPARTWSFFQSWLRFEFPLATLLFGVACTMLTVGLFRRLTHLREENPEYGLSIPLHDPFNLNNRWSKMNQDKAAATAIAQSVVNAAVVDWSYDFNLRRLRQARFDSWRKWLIGHFLPNGNSHLFMALASVAITLPLIWWIDYINPQKKPKTEALGMIGILFPILMGIAVNCGPAIYRWQRQYLEFLLPISRARFARLFVLARLHEGLITGASAIVCSLLVWGWKINDKWSTLLLVMPVLTLLLAMICFLFLAFMMSFRRFLLMLFTTVILMSLGAAGVCGQIERLVRHFNDQRFAIVLFAGIGLNVILYKLAVRRWERVELA